MTPDSVLSIFHQALEVMVVLILVLLVPSLIVGLLVAMFQAATQINEMTLVFVPKMLGVVVALLIFFPWMLKIITEFTTNNIVNISMYIH